MIDDLNSFVKLSKGKSSIKLGHRVKDVDYSVNQLKTTDLKTNKETVFKGDAIVCTVSVGVLNANLLNFIPALP